MARKSVLQQGSYVSEGEVLRDGVICEVRVDAAGELSARIARGDDKPEIALAAVAALAASMVGIERAEEIVRRALRGD